MDDITYMIYHIIGIKVSKFDIYNFSDNSNKLEELLDIYYKRDKSRHFNWLY
jgi:hypothetical protein